ncbi:MAG: hypothetical protein AAGF33_02240 [Pseudomonadota bacterium]
MEWLPIFDKNAAYIWTVYALAAVTLSTTVYLTLRRARAADRLQASTDAQRRARK